MPGGQFFALASMSGCTVAALIVIEQATNTR
jgi:hypothetical protein